MGSIVIGAMGRMGIMKGITIKVIIKRIVIKVIIEGMVIKVIIKGTMLAQGAA